MRPDILQRLEDFNPLVIDPELIDGKYQLAQGSINGLAYSSLLKTFSGQEPIFLKKDSGELEAAIYNTGSKYVGYGTASFETIKELDLFPAEIFSVRNVNGNHWVLLKYDISKVGDIPKIDIIEYDPFQGVHHELLRSAYRGVLESFGEGSLVKRFSGKLKRQADGSSCGIIANDYFRFLIDCPDVESDVGDGKLSYEPGARSQRASFINQLYNFSPSPPSVDPSQASYTMYRDHMLHLTASQDLLSSIEGGLYQSFFRQ